MVLADGVLSGQLGVWKGGMETTLEIFAFIRDYMALHLWAPTLREIADGCGLAHPSSVVRHLEHLEAWRNRDLESVYPIVFFDAMLRP